MRIYPDICGLWDRGDVDTLNSYFGYTIHNLRGKPTNSEFIAMISDKILMGHKHRTNAINKNVYRFL